MQKAKEENSFLFICAFLYICISGFFYTWPGKSSGSWESKEKCYVQPNLLRYESMNSFNSSNSV